MRTILFISLIICSSLLIVTETIYPIEGSLLKIILAISTLLSGVLMFIFSALNLEEFKNRLANLNKDFVKNDKALKIQIEKSEQIDETLAKYEQVKLEFEVSKKSVLTLEQEKQNIQLNLNVLKQEGGENNIQTQSLKQELSQAQSNNNELSIENNELKRNVLNLEMKLAQSINIRPVKKAESTIATTDFQFNNKEECLQVLADKKWNEVHQYECSKCENTNYNALNHLNSRKCTRCNHIESAMARTIFTGVRFPLEKAFHITQLVFDEPKIPIEKLIKETELSKNTCWKFKKKIIKQISAYQKKNKLKANKWEDIIYPSFI